LVGSYQTAEIDFPRTLERLSAVESKAAALASDDSPLRELRIELGSSQLVWGHLERLSL
jgi:hypothetical protein